MAERASRRGGGSVERRQPGVFGRALYRVLRGLVLMVAKAFGRVEIVGRENVPPEGGFVIAPVHRSNVDFALATLITRRRIRFLAKESIWKSRALGRFVEFGGGFPVHRGAVDRESLRTCVAILGAGEPLLVFPEGTRKAGAAVEDLFDGPAYLSCRAGVPIVPVGIGGSAAMMPRGAKMLRRSKLVMIVGEPLEPPAVEGRASRREIKAITETLRETVQALFDDSSKRAAEK
ncbi:MAG: lysophospholipid acyltransferase family protein [Acidimicrobiia bacterium]